jgi:hypothetical protein
MLSYKIGLVLKNKDEVECCMVTSGLPKGKST